MDSTAFQVGTRPFNVLSGDAVVSQRHDSSTMNPDSPAAATRKPRRAPRFVASSR